MIRKFYKADLNNNAIVGFWGRGTPIHRFLFVVDIAEGGIFALENKSRSKINFLTK